jgi:hypothetical protein
MAPRRIGIGRCPSERKMACASSMQPSLWQRPVEEILAYYSFPEQRRIGIISEVSWVNYELNISLKIILYC